MLLCSLASCCSHAAAVMMKIELAVRLGVVEKSVTSEKCLWNMSKRKVKTAQLTEMNFQRPKRKDTALKPVVPRKNPRIFRGKLSCLDT